MADSSWLPFLEQSAKLQKKREWLQKKPFLLLESYDEFLSRVKSHKLAGLRLLPSQWS